VQWTTNNFNDTKMLIPTVMVAAASKSSAYEQQRLVNRPADFRANETSDVHQQMFTFLAQRWWLNSTSYFRTGKGKTSVSIQNFRVHQISLLHLEATTRSMISCQFVYNNACVISPRRRNTSTVSLKISLGKSYVETDSRHMEPVSCFHNRIKHLSE